MRRFVWNPVRLVLGALFFTCALTGVATASEDDERFRLLKFDSHPVKWGDAALGTGAHVTYAFAQTELRFDDARNCRSLVPMHGLAARSRISSTRLIEETIAAFRAWEEVADIRFEPVADASQADIVIGAQARPFGRAFADVAYTSVSDNGVKAIERSLVCLNPDVPWKVGFDGDVDVYDFRYTMIHEIGHAIGLDHPGPTGQIMAFAYNEAFRELQAGDIRGAVTLYGASIERLASTDASSRP
ncbi:hypothetical protein J2T57_001103 [Natronocella acetinitrilica]|uniref:Peptidase metallopeptidase domain-containing protein n=1 Tax=Natronocella acetinitrilica TaxID=414046 RepID=A0AAE3G1U3_9GAMM|nr:matrixin family metalloprotease [Natronocella acetinitrilica]MCP1674004.1 hypothetical protein [Natronocella acetinitrilica]